MAARSSKKTPSFENGLETLETIAKQMETADLPLEELMKLYEEGLKLAGDLETRLQAARGRMLEIRKGQDGQPEAADCTIEQQMSMIPAQEEEQ